MRAGQLHWAMLQHEQACKSRLRMQPASRCREQIPPLPPDSLLPARLGTCPPCSHGLCLGLGGGDAAGAADDVMGSQHPGCWVHMDAAAAAAAALEHGAAFYDGSAGSTCDVLPAQPAAAAAAAAAARLVACMAAGGSALMPPHMTAWERGGSGGEGGGAAGACGGSGGAHSAAKLELLRACQRDVAGTLDDVVGHE